MKLDYSFFMLITLVITLITGAIVFWHVSVFDGMTVMIVGYSIVTTALILKINQERKK